MTYLMENYLNGLEDEVTLILRMVCMRQNIEFTSVASLLEKPPFSYKFPGKEENIKKQKDRIYKYRNMSVAEAKEEIEAFNQKVKDLYEKDLAEYNQHVSRYKQLEDFCQNLPKDNELISKFVEKQVTQPISFYQFEPRKPTYIQDTPEEWKLSHVQFAIQEISQYEAYINKQIEKALALNKAFYELLLALKLKPVWSV